VRLLRLSPLPAAFSSSVPARDLLLFMRQRSTSIFALGCSCVSRVGSCLDHLVFLGALLSSEVLRELRATAVRPVFVLSRFWIRDRRSAGPTLQGRPFFAVG